YKITKIKGQPTYEDLNLLTKDLTKASGSVTAQNKGGEHGHVGMVVEETKYITFTRNAEKFVVPTNPGPYPTHVNVGPVIQECQIAKHKAKVVEYETYLGVKNYLCRIIVKAVNHEWHAEVESKPMGFNHLSPKALLNHLQNVGESLNHMDMTELISTSRSHGMSKQLKANAMQDTITLAMLDSGASKKYLSFHNKECNSPDFQIKSLSPPTELSFQHPTLHYCQPVHSPRMPGRQWLYPPHAALMIVATSSNNGYTTVFLPEQQGVDTIHANDVSISSIAPPALQGWWDN
ncbi:hypothetical protein ACHAW6_016161, partial [Cyclotella cf. meneghiniana]